MCNLVNDVTTEKQTKENESRILEEQMTIYDIESLVYCIADFDRYQKIGECKYSSILYRMRIIYYIR